jgi:hypothetical protein
MTCLRTGAPTLVDRLSNADVKLLDLPGSFAFHATGSANGYTFLFSDGEIFASQDGLHFVGTGFTSGDKMNAVAFGNDVYVIVGELGKIWVSTGPGAGPDYDWGWTEYSPAGGYSGTFYSILFDGTRFITVGEEGSEGGEIQRSTDTGSGHNGQTWEHITPDDDVDEFYDIAQGNGVLIAVGYYGYSGDTPVAQMSDDGGATWAAQTFDGLGSPPANDGMQRIIFTGVEFIMSGLTDVTEDAKGMLLQRTVDGEAYEDISDKLLGTSFRCTTTTEILW